MYKKRTSVNVSNFQLPSILIVFGITGDLVKKKILKSLYHLFLKKQIPSKFKVYGFSRRSMDTISMRSYLLEIMQSSDFPKQEMYDRFLALFEYVRGDFTEKAAYENLAQMLGQIDGKWQICSNKLFYLAVPPQAYETIIKNLHESGLTKPCSPKEGLTRVILEKPFGTDLKTAQKLDQLLGSLFKEEQIYRVDHYLGKETVRNIMAFRFGNIFFNPIWSNKFIEKIEVRLLQQSGIEERGEFYDKIGALRDVGQNHMLQLLALFIMDEPATFSADDIKQARAKALLSLKRFTGQEMATKTQRGQYRNYAKVEGVAADSETETYFQIETESDSENFRNIPLILESGKCRSESVTEVVVTFKSSQSPFSDKSGKFQNTLIYQILPQEKISICFLSKKPGFIYELRAHELGFKYRQAYSDDQFIDDYEALLHDIFKGDQTLFVSTKEIMSEWSFIEPIIYFWKNKKKPDLFIY
jgi:glucose-6-phosphate 1-dehydrogenase